MIAGQFATQILWKVWPIEVKSSAKVRQTAGNGVSNQRVRERQIAASSENLTFLDPDLDTGKAKSRISLQKIKYITLGERLEKILDSLVIRF